MYIQPTKKHDQSDSGFLPLSANKLLLIAFILLVASLLAACGSSGEEADPSAEDAVNATEVAESEADAGAESEADAGAESEADAGAESEADAGAESEADAGAESEADAGAESEADAGAESEADAGAESEADAGAEADSAEADSAEADSAEADSAEADSAEADSAEADSAEADSAEADSGEADSAEAEAGAESEDSMEANSVPPTESSPTETEVSPPLEPVPSPQVRILATLLNVRSGPSTNNEIVDALAEGQIVLVLAKNQDGSWYNIQLSDGNNGWIANEFTEPVGQMGMIDVPVAEMIPPAVESGKAMPTPEASESSSAPSDGSESSPPSEATVVTIDPTATPGEATNPPNEPTIIAIAPPVEPSMAPSEATVAPSEPTVAPTVTPSEATPVPPAPDNSAFRYGIQAHLIHIDRSLPFANTTGLGFGWIKQQIEWNVWEPSQGNIDWSQMDGIAQEAQANGLTVFYSVVGAPDWAREAGFDGSVAGPPANPATFANFLSQMAARYCNNGVGAIEVWNEQNLHYEWGNQPLDPAAYMALLKPAYSAIKAACPNMIVVSGALTPAGNVGNLAVDDFTYLQGMFNNGLAQYADVIGAHPSGYNVPPSLRYGDACAFIQEKGTTFKGPCDTPHHSWSFLSTLEGYRDLIQQNGATQKIWATEFGWAAGGSFAAGYEYADDNSLDEQAEWSVEAFQYMRNSGYVSAAFLWNLNFRVVANNTEKAQWGIIADNTQPLPAFLALQAMPK